MEANKYMPADKFVASCHLSSDTVKKIGTALFTAFAAAFSFLFIACYLKALYGGSWKVPLIVAGASTAVSLCLLLFTKEQAP
jgi:hypothetical protein